MNKLKQIVFFVVLVLFLTTCGRYNKILNKGSAQEQYSLATEMYESKKYSKAVELFEKIIPKYQGKPQMERIQYMMSQSYYNIGDYTLSSYYFDKFTKNYPKSSKKEEAAYLSARSYYLLSSSFSRDQVDTKKAIESLQSFINTYPNSDKIDKVNELILDLQNKLEMKAFEIAYQYYHTENYLAAIVAFDNFLLDYLGTDYKEKALHYSFLASYDLAKNSTFSKKKQRYNDAKKKYEKFIKQYKESKYQKEMNQLFKKIEKELLLLADT